MKSTTFTFSAPALLGLVFADGWNDNTETIPPNTKYLNNGFTTTIPEPFMTTITECTNSECTPRVYTFSELPTLMMKVEKRMVLSDTTASSASPASAFADVSTYEAGAVKLAASFAGIVGIALMI